MSGQEIPDCEGYHSYGDMPVKATYHFGVTGFVTLIYGTYYPGEEIHLCVEHASELYKTADEEIKNHGCK